MWVLILYICGINAISQEFTTKESCEKAGNLATQEFKQGFGYKTQFVCTKK